MIDWIAWAPVIGLFLLHATVLQLAWTLLGALVMRFFVPQVPLWSRFLVLFWAALRVFAAALVIAVLSAAVGQTTDLLLEVLGVLAMFAVGWLVTRDLGRRYGTPTRFPAVGAKLMATMFVLMSALIGLYQVPWRSFV